MLRKILGMSRIIKTARSVEEMNAAVKKGYWPLVKEVKPSSKIKTKNIIHQHKITGDIELIGDFRRQPRGDYKYLTAIWDYPYNFESPFAAYLIPKNLKKGEKVLLEDLIDDYVDWCWNQGDATRLESCKAIWNGSDFEILYDKKDHICVIG